MPKKGDDLSVTAESIQKENDTVLSAIKSSKKKVVPTLVPLSGTAGNDNNLESEQTEQITEPTAEELQAEAQALALEREKEKKRKDAERSKQEKLKEEAAAHARAEEINNSPWIACRPKVRKARVDLLDKIYNFRKVQDYGGTKQDFYDEGLALLEEKYRDVAKEVVAKQTA